MRIAFFGSSLLSAYWNGAATYYRGIIRALDELGYDVTFYEPDAYERQQHRDIEPPSWARSVVYSTQDKSGVAAALEEASQADLLIKASGVGVFDELLDQAVLDFRRAGALTAYWDVDAPATLDAMTADPEKPLCQLVPRYDFIFTYGGGAPVVSRYKEFGARECIPIYNALDPETHHPASPDHRFAGDVGFLGNRLPDREARVEEFFLRPAAACPEQQFVLGGNGWQDKSLPASVRYVGHVYTADHNAFNCSTTLVLNISRASMARYGYSPATRVFEAAGAGACLVTDAWEGIEHFLEPWSEVIVVHDAEEVAKAVHGVTRSLANDIGIAARRRVLAEHTYRHRALQFDRVLNGRDTSVLAYSSTGD